jgi:hypothetical protein
MRMRAALLFLQSALLVLLSVLLILLAIMLAGCGSAVSQPNVQIPSTIQDGGVSSAAGVLPTGSNAPPPAVAHNDKTGLHPISDEGRVTYSVTLAPGSCHAQDGGQLPDPRCTPGSYDPAVTQATIHKTICVTGWTATVRPPVSQTNTAKFSVAYPAYSIPAGTKAELDHLVPLELGGANDITNLWPEVGKVPNPKDSVENRLRSEVCAGTVTLSRARAEIAANWLAVSA